MLDLTNRRDAHVNQRLRSDLIIWLGTVRPDNRPHFVPVWFLWDGETFLIFSKPGDQKMRNLRTNKNVFLALDDSKIGHDVILIEGVAELLQDTTLGTTVAAYAEKYATLMAGNNWTPEAMGKIYSEVIRITPSKFLGWGGS